jgi:cysteine sulfinate desulfinase/cysteine desulfurase-like protein
MWNRSQQLILRSAVKDLQVKRIITSKIEHHAVFIHGVSFRERVWDPD